MREYFLPQRKGRSFHDSPKEENGFKYSEHASDFLGSNLVSESKCWLLFLAILWFSHLVIYIELKSSIWPLGNNIIGDNGCFCCDLVVIFFLVPSASEKHHAGQSGGAQLISLLLS